MEELLAKGVGVKSLDSNMIKSHDTTSDPCSDCMGRCCRSYFVPVTGYDVWRISTGQRLPPESFVVVRQHGDDTSQHGFYLDPAQKPYYLTLDKKDRLSRLRPCIFLVELATGEGKCGIYPDRPAVCRAYPLSLMHGEARMTHNAVCPPGSWSQAELSHTTSRDAPRRAYIELDLYAQVVARWNSRVAQDPGESVTLNEYFSYLMNAFQALSRLELEIGESEMALIEASWPTPPRNMVWLDESSLSRDDHPWLDFLLRVNGVLGSFYQGISAPRISIPVNAG